MFSWGLTISFANLTTTRLLEHFPLVMSRFLCCNTALGGASVSLLRFLFTFFPVSKFLVHTVSCYSWDVKLSFQCVVV